MRLSPLVDLGALRRLIERARQPFRPAPSRPWPSPRGPRLGLAFGEEGLAVAHCPGEGTPLIDALHLLPAAQSLPALVRGQRQWRRLPVVATLPVTQYQVFSLPRPAVAPHELTRAVGWQLHDELAQPLHETLLALCETPSSAPGEESRQLWVVAAARAAVEHHAAAVEAAGLRLLAIDIPLLALRNLGLQLSAGPAPRWLLLIGERSLLSVVAQGRPWLQRALRSSAAERDPIATAHWLADELGRSHSYLRRHPAFPDAPGEVLLVGSSLLARHLTAALTGRPGFAGCAPLERRHFGSLRLAALPDHGSPGGLSLLACGAALRGLPAAGAGAC